MRAGCIRENNRCIRDVPCENECAMLPKADTYTPTEQQLRQEVEALRRDALRYQVVRRMHVPAFRDAFVLSNRTGKPFDEIIDDLAPFYGLAKTK